LAWRIGSAEKEMWLKENDASLIASFVEFDYWMAAPAHYDIIPAQAFSLLLASRALKSFSSSMFKPTAAA
jgi:hypothetical protein